MTRVIQLLTSHQFLILSSSVFSRVQCRLYTKFHEWTEIETHTMLPYVKSSCLFLRVKNRFLPNDIALAINNVFHCRLKDTPNLIVTFSQAPLRCGQPR